MKYPTETAIVLNKIRKDSGLNDAALSLIGITPQKISDAIKQCMDKGLSRKKAMETVYNIWRKSNPEIKEITGPASDKEMTLMGFYRTPTNTWKHNTYLDIQITDEYRKSVDFKIIEEMILAKQNDSQPPHGDNKTE